MTPAQPATSIWLHVPRHCRMAGEFTSDRDVRIEFGDLAEETSVVFDRIALERFTTLGNKLLEVPVYETEPAYLPVLVAPSSPDDPGVPSLAAGENSAFIQELRTVSELMSSYARWVIDPKTTDVTPFSFPEQMLLSVRLAALGQAVRELTYARTER